MNIEYYIMAFIYMRQDLVIELAQQKIRGEKSRYTRKKKKGRRDLSFSVFSMNARQYQLQTSL